MEVAGVSDQKIWCMQCWNSFKVPADAIKQNKVIDCDDCETEGLVVGHIVRGMVFCNDCYSMGCNAAVCRCNCHKEEIGG